MPQNLTNEKSTLDQVKAWCCQATSHYLSQYRLRSMSSYGVTKPQWVKHDKTSIPALPGSWKQSYKTVCLFNSLWPRDTRWWHRSGSKLPQVVAWRHQTITWFNVNHEFFCDIQLKAFYKKKFLTHWGRDKMDAISQTVFSNAFSWMKMCEFCLRFHWSLFLRVQLTIFHHWFR